MARSSSQGPPREWIYGLHAVQAVLKTEPGRIAEIRVLRERRDQRLKKLHALAEQQGILLVPVRREELDKLVDGNHQGVAALCSRGQVRDEHFLPGFLEQLPGPPFLLVLDGVTDPHNLGACLRTADAAGVDAVIAPRDKSVGINATVRKVASGAADSVPFVAVTNLARTLKHLQGQGVWIVGTAGEGEATLYQADLRGALALVLGAEGSGLRRLTREHCDLLVRLPMAGVVASLNVSVAAGICLYEGVRQRSGGGTRSDVIVG